MRSKLFAALTIGCAPTAVTPARSADIPPGDPICSKADWMGPIAD